MRKIKKMDIYPHNGILLEYSLELMHRNHIMLYMLLYMWLFSTFDFLSYYNLVVKLFHERLLVINFKTQRHIWK